MYRISMIITCPYYADGARFIPVLYWLRATVAVTMPAWIVASFWYCHTLWLLAAMLLWQQSAPALELHMISDVPRISSPSIVCYVCFTILLLMQPETAETPLYDLPYGVWPSVRRLIIISLHYFQRSDSKGAHSRCDRLPPALVRSALQTSCWESDSCAGK